MENTIINKVAEIELSYKSKVKPSERPKITSSKDAEAILRPLYNPERIEIQEQFIILVLNRANKVLGHYLLSSGGGAATIVDPRIVMQVLINSNAHGFIISHNHPSGETRPSESDKVLTNRLKDCAKLFDIQLMDHIIIGENYLSFADEGLL